MTVDWKTEQQDTFLENHIPDLPVPVLAQQMFCPKLRGRLKRTSELQEVLQKLHILLGYNHKKYNKYFTRDV